MYISVRRYRNVRSVREVMGKIEASFLPLIRQSPGFIGYYAVDGGGGTMATISLFSTERMAVDSNEVAAVWMAEHAAELQPEPPEIIAGKAEIVAKP